jgi:hypothetical protein
MDKFTGKSKASPFSMKSKVAKRPLRDGTKLRREGDRIIDYQKKLMKDIGFSVWQMILILRNLN